MTNLSSRNPFPSCTVFIDYGPEWEEAWDKYIEEWTPPVGSEGYLPASTLLKDISTPLRTAKEQLAEPYQDHIVFYCHYQYEPGTLEGPWAWVNEWESLPTCPCRIISREPDVDAYNSTSYHYAVVMLDEDELEDGMVYNAQHKIPVGENHILTNVPRHAIQVRDKLYSKDELVENSFRQEMMMPDEIFPESWRNL